MYSFRCEDSVAAARPGLLRVRDHPVSEHLAGVVGRVLAAEPAQKNSALRQSKANGEEELIADTARSSGVEPDQSTFALRAQLPLLPCNELVTQRVRSATSQVRGAPTMRKTSLRIAPALFGVIASVVALAAGPALGAQINKCTKITKPGFYVLTRNLTATGDCLVVAANFVTIDLGGWVITSTGRHHWERGHRPGRFSRASPCVTGQSPAS